MAGVKSNNVRIYSFIFILSAPPAPIGFILKKRFSLQQPTWEPAASHPPRLAMPREGALPPNPSGSFVGEAIKRVH